MRTRLVGAVAVALSLCAFGGIAYAAETAPAASGRPNEDELFGGSPAASPPQAPPSDGGVVAAPSATDASMDAVRTLLPAAEFPATPAPLSTGLATRDDSILGDPNGGPKLSQDTAPDDPLRIGGQLYLRALARGSQGQNVKNVPFSAPALVDGYFDARPNDRVRGFVLARLSFDSTLPSQSTTSTTTNLSSNSLGVPLVSGQTQTRGPSAALDQLWLRFDIARTVFVTVGRQHVKWGTARFWSPTDFLHPQARNPLAAFDARTGFTMLKLHLPIESRAWNLYAFGLFEGATQLDATGRPVLGSDTAGTIRQLGGAVRAEILLGNVEFGLDSVLYAGKRPKVGADASFGIWDLDLYIDAGFRAGSEVARRNYNSGDVTFNTDPSLEFDARLADWVDGKYPVKLQSGIKPQITVGGTYSLKYNDNDVFTITGEYFYNTLGYDDPHVYPGLFLSNSFQYFYTGRQYASLSFVAAAPYSWNYTTFTLTTLGNLSDQSFITRFDYSLVLLTHLRFEAFGAVNYGHEAGEFRLGVSGFSVPTSTGSSREVSLAAQSFSLGLGLRVAL